MYTEFYGLSALPFQLTPDARFFFESRNHTRAMAHLTYGLNQGDGFIIVTGDVGAGKTTLVEHLFSQLDQHFLTARISNTQLGADDLLRLVASQLGLSDRGDGKAARLERLEALLRSAAAEQRRLLVVVDECQNLPIEALEELRMLLNLNGPGKAPLQGILLGQPQFRETLASPELEQLRQRVIASYHLGPLDLEDTRSYVEHRLRHVGWENDPQLAHGVFDGVYRHTGGVPRRINTLCSRLLLFGYLEGRHDLDGHAVDAVAEDLQNELMRVLPPAEIDAVAPVSSANGNDLDRRLAALEEYVRSHDRAIRRALNLAVDYLERQR